MDKVFILPELIFNIGKFLSRHDLTVCTRVSYLFNATLSPLLFQDIHIEVNIRLPRSLRTFPRERFDTFCKHAANVHHLVYAHSLYRAFFHSGYCFRQLKTLKIGRNSYIWKEDPLIDDDSIGMCLPSEEAELLARMISAEMCPILKELSLSELRPVPLHPFWQSLQDSKTIHTFKWLSGASELRCSGPRWAGEQSAHYWLSLPKSIPRDKFLAGFRFTNLHHIELQGLVRLNSGEQLRFLCQCPEVRTVTWKTWLHKYPSKEAKTLLRTITWSHLHSLDIGMNEIGDEDLKLILETIGGTGLEGCLQTLTVSMDVAATRAFDSLRRHFKALRSIKLHKGLTSAMAQEILSSCPTLETIFGLHILSDDILNGQPWVCSRLRTFQLCVFVSSESAIAPPSNQGDGQDYGQELAAKLHNGADQVVFGRLASLPYLQQLVMAPPTNLQRPEYRPPGRPLRWKLDDGLDRLAGLTGLRDIGLDQSESNVEVHDLAWMLEHWPRLRTLAGVINHGSNPDRAVLVNMLKERDVTPY
ncbi:hypothetical protein BGZ72_007353 [Mortierella alpina]|nr:hypothetical protein BGZ72_007353 [Mortierella alpina]